MHSKKTERLALSLLLAALPVGAALAQEQASNHMIEAGVLHHSLGSAYGNWNQQFVRGVFKANDTNVVNADVVHAREFGASGTLLAMGLTHTFNDAWYGSVAASGGSGFFFPRSRGDVSISRKLGAQGSVVATAGLTAINSKDGHSDRNLLLAMTWYAQNKLILEGGMRFNRSNPGSVMSNTKYVAMTYGENRKQYLSLRYGMGEEAYQFIGANDLLVNFRSNAVTGTWRKWLNQRQGFQVRAEAYHNPYYNRRGVELALFQEF